MKNGTKALFGGALMACGMTANAQTFTYFDTSNPGLGGAYPSFAQSIAYGGASSDVAYQTDGALDTSYSAYSALTGTSTFSTTQDANGWRAEGVWDGTGSLGYGYGFARFQSFFTVSEDATVTVSWDATQTDGFWSALVLRDDGSGSPAILNIGGTVDAGSVSFFADDDVRYLFIGGLAQGTSGPFLFTADSRNPAFVEVSIGAVPAPGAAAMLGVVGLAGLRRRRA